MLEWLLRRTGMLSMGLRLFVVPVLELHAGWIGGRSGLQLRSPVHPWEDEK